MPQDKNANVQQNNAPQNNIQNNAASQNSFQNNSNAQNGASYSPFNSKQNQSQGAYGFGKNSQSANAFVNQMQGANVYGNQAQASSDGTVTLQQNPKKKMMIIVIAVLMAVFAFLLAWFLFTSPKARASRQLKLGEQYLKDQKFEDAIAAFNASIKIDNKNIKPYEGLVTANKALNQYDEAADSMEQAITNIGLENIPDNDITELVDSYTVIASNAESSGDTEKAKKCYDRILELDPDNKDATAKAAVLGVSDFAAKLRKENGDLNGKTVELKAQYSGGNHVIYDNAPSETPDDANGILSVVYDDFDKDGEKEFLAISQELTENQDLGGCYDNNIIASIYKLVGNEYQLQTSETIATYQDYRYFVDYDFNISYKLTDNGCLIFTDYSGQAVNPTYNEYNYYYNYTVLSYDGGDINQQFDHGGFGPLNTTSLENMLTAETQELNNVGINVSYGYGKQSLTDQDSALIKIVLIRSTFRDDIENLLGKDNGPTVVYADKTYTDLTQSNAPDDNSNDTSSDEAQSSEAVPDGTALGDGFYEGALVSTQNKYGYISDMKAEGDYIIIKGNPGYHQNENDWDNSTLIGSGTYYVKYDSSTNIGTEAETDDPFWVTISPSDFSSYMGSGLDVVIQVKNGKAVKITFSS